MFVDSADQLQGLRRNTHASQKVKHDSQAKVAKFLSYLEYSRCPMPATGQAEQDKLSRLNGAVRIREHVRVACGLDNVANRNARPAPRFLQTKFPATPLSHTCNNAPSRTAAARLRHPL